MKFANLHAHSHYSILDGLPEPKNIIKKYKELDFVAGAITDHASISSCIEAFESAKKCGLKCILGTEANITPVSASVKDRKYSHLVLLAKNQNGWKNLIKLTSRSNDDDCFYYKPRLGFEELKPFTKDLISISGHPGSTIANSLFTDLSVYSCKKKEECYNFLKLDVEKILKKETERHLSLFDDFYYEIQLFDSLMPAQQVIAEILRSEGKKNGIRCVATTDAHYINKEDAKDQRVILCSNLKKTLKQVEEMGEDFGLSCFFRTDAYHIFSLPEIERFNTEDEIKCTVDIADSVDEYDILSPPRLPNYNTPNKQSEIEYLKEICRNGWKNKIAPIINKKNKEEYSERAKKELFIIEDAGLSGYFLIVQDFINWYVKQGGVKSAGRGSSAGSLVSYMLGITDVEPIQYGLIFERFFNSARKGSLPDIDCDVQPEYRELVIKYLKDKYGENSVAHMVTYGRLMGRGALKEVLRIHSACTFGEINRITEYIPDESKISDELETMKEKSIILWALQNRPEKFTQWCRYKDGQFSGEYAPLFQQAIRLEGTFKSQGKHAAGIIITGEDLNEASPMVRDKAGEKICGFEMNGLEKIGLVKFDLLSVNSLSKLKMINEIGTI